jgi:hypothetical protein
VDNDCVKVIDFRNGALFPADADMETICTADPLPRVDLLFHLNVAGLPLRLLRKGPLADARRAPADKPYSMLENCAEMLGQQVQHHSIALRRHHYLAWIEGSRAGKPVQARIIVHV